MNLSQRFQAGRTYTETLCKPLQTEDYVPQPVDFASPPKWHLAHTTWFFEEFVLKKYLAGYTIFDEQFSYLFNSYYNTVGDRIIRTNRGSITRPGVEEVYAYRKHVDAAMLDLLEKEVDDNLQELLILGLNHEQQHQELLIADLKHTFSGNPTFPIYRDDFDLTADKNAESGFAKIGEGVYEIGFSGGEFSFDNELGRHKVFLHDFEISKSLVTNGDYLDFINDKAYERFELWLDEGWAWVNAEEIRAPLYWYKIEGVWHQYTLAGLKKVEPEAMLSHISFYEAAAFAEWKGMRLPTEMEWEIAADQFQWGQRWEWTNSAYLPYPGFQKAPGAIGEYNGKFMINQMVLRGASVATSPQHSRPTYRNFFPANARWQYTGIRLVK